ncbi:hypothetical protein FB45DRAFT_33052 [Roridomyces roridus]|uniref:Uncharacterized protein n=1 Tax=Roridomyces roridus TaxID=1738132 RepID=A0AAD7CKW1_9AGAR|nr:hypothetical protein FB45DRAFT_33052 [Roridomyces roridus]
MAATTYTLTSSQRLRLIRATHKLGGSLGPAETTFIPSHTRSSSSTSTESKRLGRIFTSTDGDVLRSASLDEPVSPFKRHAPPPALFLRPTSSSAPPSPLSPTFSLNSPVTPPPAVTRRRKMDKLTRTLGENVPPELVFPAPRHRRRVSTLNVPVPAEQPFSFPSTVPVPAMDDDDSESSEWEWETPGASPDGVLHRREKGWSGEWGGRVRDMEDVVQALRVLRLK